MHSRIFQVSRDPIPVADRISESSIPDWFFSSVADYVNADTDRSADIQWLLSAYKPFMMVGREPDSIVFTADAKRIYFRPRYQKFLEKAMELSNSSLEAFIGLTPQGIGIPMYELNSSYNDKFGFYIYYDDTLWTMDEWMRETDLREPFFVGGTVDYHF